MRDTSVEATTPQGEGATLRPRRKLAALLGFLQKAEVDALFTQQPLEIPDGSDPLELWRQFAGQRQALPAFSPGAIEPLPDSLASVVESIKTRPTYRKYYEAVADYSFALVPVESLLAPQWQADVEYVDELTTNLGSAASLEDQLRFAMSEGKITEPIVIGNSVTFLSPRRDLHAQPVPTVRKTGPGEFEIVICAESRPNYVQVAQLDGRLFLANGVHKVLALYKMGITKVPCVCRTVHSLQETGLDPRSTTLLNDPVFKSPRPALVRDFLDPAAAAPVYIRSMYQLLQVQIGVAKLMAPALPTPGTTAQSRSVGPGAEIPGHSQPKHVA